MMQDERSKSDSSSESENSDEDDEQKRQIDSVNGRIVSMSDEQRHRFELFRSANCRPPVKMVMEILREAVRPAAVQKTSGVVACGAARLFAADLIETARRLSDDLRPLSPDMIMIAYSELEQQGKIPGKGPGVKRNSVR
jgi:hypothetical protein